MLYPLSGSPVPVSPGNSHGVRPSGNALYAALGFTAMRIRYLPRYWISSRRLSRSRFVPVPRALAHFSVVICCKSYNCEMMLRLLRYVMTLRYSLILTYLFCGIELLCLWENSKSTWTVLALSYVTKYHSGLFSYLLIDDYLVLLIKFIYWRNSSSWYLFRCCTLPLCFIHRSGICNHRTIFSLTSFIHRINNNLS